MEELEKIDEYVEENDAELDERKSGITGWGISLSLHILILLVLGTLIVVKEMIKEQPNVRLVQIDLPPELKDPPTRDIVEKPIIVPHTKPVDSEVTLINTLDLEDIKLESEDEENNNDIKGRENAVSTAEMAGQGVAFVMGAGGGASGAFGREKGGNKKRWTSCYGPNAKSASSTMEAALKWLAVHQSPDGHWDSVNYYLNCQINPKCEPGKTAAGDENAAMTGLATLCFLGAGYDHKHMSKWRKTVKVGIEWLLARQGADGLIGERNYEHPVCAMALAEAYAMSGDIALREPAQKAVDIVLARQTKDNDGYPLGWDYIRPNPARMDISVSGWNIMALKSAVASNLNVQDGLEGSKKFLELAWKSANPNWQNLDPYGKSVFPYTCSIDGKTSRDHLSFVGALAGVFLGYKPGDILLDTLANDMTDRWFVTNKYRNNSYALYYASLASFQIKGKHWDETWGNPTSGFVPWLVQTQYKTEDCYDGTWKHEKEEWHGAETSSVLLHTYKLLALEVGIRYLPLLEQIKKM